MGKILVLTSGKGGVGKTASVSNIAVALAEQGKKVLMADFDLGLRNLDIAIGMSDIIVYDIMDVLEGKCDFERAVFKFENYGGLEFLPAAQSTDKEYLDSDEVKKLFELVRDNYDYILIDCPAGIDAGFKSAIAAADMGIVIATPELSSIRDADKVITLMEMNDVPEIKLIINRVRPDLMRKGEMITVGEITDMLNVPLIGIVVEDENVLKAQRNNTLAVKMHNSPAGDEFRNIAGRIEGKNIPITELKKRRFGIFRS